MVGLEGPEGPTAGETFGFRTFGGIVGKGGHPSIKNYLRRQLPSLGDGIEDLLLVIALLRVACLNPSHKRLLCVRSSAFFLVHVLYFQCLLEILHITLLAHCGSGKS